ncbi:hypothetical protein, partial [Enterococcus mundtii]
MTEILRRITLEIYDPEEYKKHWIDQRDQEGESISTKAKIPRD